MATRLFETENYGKVWAKDVMIDMDGTNLTEGIDVFDENYKFICDFCGIMVEDIESDLEMEELIETYFEYKL